MTVMTKPQQSVRLEPVHPKPEEAHTMKAGLELRPAISQSAMPAKRLNQKGA